MLNTRITRDEMLMEVAHVIAKRGTCSRLQVGAVFSREGRIVSAGYNGAPAGMPHCVHEEYTWKHHFSMEMIPSWLKDFFQSNDSIGHQPIEGTVYSYDGERITASYHPGNSISPSSGCEVSEHAERNAIAWAARHGLALEGTEVHVTHMPCLACARTMINAGVTRVMYKEEYRLKDGVILLDQAGVEVWDWYRPEQKIDPKFHL